MLRSDLCPYSHVCTAILCAYFIVTAILSTGIDRKMVQAWLVPWGCGITSYSIPVNEKQHRYLVPGTSTVVRTWNGRKTRPCSLLGTRYPGGIELQYDHDCMQSFAIIRTGISIQQATDKLFAKN